MKRKKVLLIVPHQDDEINVAGALLRRLFQQDFEINILYTTNGNMYGKGSERAIEARNAVNILSSENTVIRILDYVDQSRSGCVHRYHDFELCKRWEDDIREYIMQINPDILLCVDLDIHPDHMATSLIVEKCIGQILKDSQIKDMLVLKGYAYATAYNAVDDYYDINLKSVVNPARARGQLINPVYRWEDRLRIPIPLECRTALKKNVIYQALQCHETQRAEKHARKIINSDAVYWIRKTCNLAYQSEIQASSGNTAPLNDFRFFDIENVMSRKLSFYSIAWRPDEEDAEKKFRITFPKPYSVNRISFYETIEECTHIEKAKIRFDNGYEIIVTEIDKAGKENRIEFEPQKDITEVEFQILEYTGVQPGITEFEVYETQEDRLLFIKIMYQNQFVYEWIYPKKHKQYKVYAFYLIRGAVELKDFEEIILRQGDDYEILRVQSKEDENIYDEVRLIEMSRYSYYSQKISLQIKNFWVASGNLLKSKFIQYCKYANIIGMILLKKFKSRYKRVE